MTVIDFQDYLNEMMRGNPKYTLKNAELYFSKYYKDFLQYYKMILIDTESIARQREWSGFIYNVQQSVDNLIGYLKTYRTNYKEVTEEVLKIYEGRQDKEYETFVASKSLDSMFMEILELTDFMYSGIEEPNENWTDEVYRQKERENYQLWLQELTKRFVFDKEFGKATLNHFRLLSMYSTSLIQSMKIIKGSSNMILTNINNELLKHIGE